jgi:type I restriction enzyme M protein
MAKSLKAKSKPKQLRLPPSGANKFCNRASLKNESDVEQFFVLPLLADLGFTADYLETKANIPAALIGKGKKRRSYIPDYQGYTKKAKQKPIIIIDAKHPNEPAEEGVNDAQLYASVIRRKMAAPKPEQFCIGVNGDRLIAKHYESDVALHDLSFEDFADGSPKYQAFRDGFNREALASLSIEEKKPSFEFRPIAPIELPAIFEACHKAIWKAEKRGPASAFYEFAKVMCVKIDEDRRLREYLKSNHIDASAGFVPRNAVHFSEHWIEEMEESTDSPIDTILFDALSKKLEAQIAIKKKKRIFEQGEGIDLAPSVIKNAVAFLQHFDLFTVDEDLNGRLFETFLTAAMRGKDLGQFFTPRSVVKFMVKMARLEADADVMDSVLDGCCGTGGFLIEAMADMSINLSQNAALTSKQRESLMENLRNESLWGIDAGKDPQMARIARLNMLLHRDGGSRIYFADALDKRLRTEPGLPLQTRLEIDELRDALAAGKLFSCILSNPPFSMTYERKKTNELAVLQDYKLAVDAQGKRRSSLRSSVMFLERYWDLLEEDGRLITIMDESVLNTLTAKPFRQFILDKYFIKAVIALPKNSFVKAQGSVNTSVLYLVKKTEIGAPQPQVFMAICGNVGHSDSGKERPQLNQLPAILEIFGQYEKTGKLPESQSSIFTVADLITENPTLRLDAQYFNPKYFDTMANLETVATARKWKLVPLEALLDGKIAGGATPRGAAYPDDGPKFIRVQNVRPGALVWNSEDDVSIDTRTHTVLLKRSQLKPNHVVLTITGTYGVAAVVPQDFGEANINQHSVRFAVSEAIIPEYLAVFLNSNLCRPQLDRAATGSSRLALDYPAIRKLQILYPSDKGKQQSIADNAIAKVKESFDLHRQAEEMAKAIAEIPI